MRRSFFAALAGVFAAIVAAGAWAAATTLVGPVQSFSCTTGQFASALSAATGAFTCSTPTGAADFSVVTKTSAYTTSNSDSAVMFNNAGASASVTITAPSTPTVGENHCFLVDAAQTFEFLANTGETITVGSTTGASAGNVQSSTTGSQVCLYAETTTAWRAYAMTGTWQVN